MSHGISPRFLGFLRGGVRQDITKSLFIFRRKFIVTYNITIWLRTFSDQ